MAGAASGLPGAVAPPAHGGMTEEEGREGLLPFRSDCSEFLIRSVVATLSSEKTQVAYQFALQEFLRWTAERQEPLSKPLVETWRAARPAPGRTRPPGSPAPAAPGRTLGSVGSARERKTRAHCARPALGETAPRPVVSGERGDRRSAVPDSAQRRPARPRGKAGE